MRAYTRYTVRMIATIRPIQFSALKVLNPLDNEDEHGEDDDRQADVKQIRHHKLLWKGMCYGPIKNLVSGGLSRPDDSYAAERWFLTDPMRGLPASARALGTRGAADHDAPPLRLHSDPLSIQTALCRLPDPALARP